MSMIDAAWTGFASIEGPRLMDRTKFTARENGTLSNCHFEDTCMYVGDTVSGNVKKGVN